MLAARLSAKLAKHHALGLTRQLNVFPANVISFASSDYLGLMFDPRVISAYQKGAAQYGFGAGSSQLIFGYTAAHQALEEAFAHYLQRDRALVFNNGYLANLGVMQTVLNPDDLIYQDKLNHASLLDAAKLCEAEQKRYRHADVAHLKALLEHASRPPALLITEHVFSMRGDLAPLEALVQLSQNQNLSLMVDDAHGVGLIDFPFSQDEVPILVCPLSKAFGGQGAIVAGSALLIDSLTQFARTYMYTTGMPPSIACGLHQSLSLVQSEPWRRHKVFENVTYFKQGAAARKIAVLESGHPIQILPIANANLVVPVQQNLLRRGFGVAAIRPPTVPPGESCLRISLSCRHEKTQIDAFLDAVLAALQDEYEPHSTAL